MPARSLERAMVAHAEAVLAFGPSPFYEDMTLAQREAAEDRLGAQVDAWIRAHR